MPHDETPAGSSGSASEPPHRNAAEDDNTLVAGPPTGASASRAEGARAATGANAPADPSGGHVFAQRFELVRMLGEGGMGRVYLARDQYVDNREVALKVLHPKYSRHEGFRKLFFREIKTAQRFVSEHVNQVRDTGQTEDGTLFLTMDLIKGEDLDTLLLREKQLNVRHALDIAKQVLMALQSGHDHGFVHRDVKPSNIMLADRITKVDDNPYGVGVRVLDFGIAGLAAEIESGQLVGTPNYMSPEQVQGERLDARSDLFAVGVVLYEMITGERPFEGQTLAQVTTAILETDVAPKIHDISELSRPIQGILERALEKDRDKRFQSAGEFIRAIEKSKAYRLPRVMPVWAALGLVLLAGAAGAEAYLLFDSMKKIERLEERNTTLSDDLESTRTALEAARNADQDTTILTDRIASLNAKIQAVEGERDAALSARDTALSTSKNASEETIALRAANGALQDKIDDLQDDIAGNLRRIQELEKENDRDRALNNRPAVASSTFDATLIPLWSRGEGRSALAALDDLLVHGAVKRILPGERYLRDLTKLVGAIETIEDNPGDEGMATRAAAASEIVILVPLVRDGLESFQLEAKEWLEFDDDLSDDEAPPRFETLSALVDDLVIRGTEAVEGMGTERQEQWEAIAGGDALQSPRDALVFSTQHEDQRYLREELTRFSDALRSRLVLSDTLLVEALQDRDSIDEWSAILEGRADLGSAAERRTVAQFAFARNWFGDPTFVGTPRDKQLFNTDVAFAPKDWTTALGLAHALVSPGSAYPVPRSGNLFYRVTDNDGAVTWRNESFVEQVDGTWKIRVEVIDSTGLERLGERTIEIVRDGKRFGRDGRTLVELDQTPMPQASEYAVKTEIQPPVGRVQAREWRAFVDEVTKTPPLCLVLTDDVQGFERWVSPRYGLVYERTRTGTAELVFGNYAR